MPRTSVHSCTAVLSTVQWWDGGNLGFVYFDDWHFSENIPMFTPTLSLAACMTLTWHWTRIMGLVMGQGEWNLFWKIIIVIYKCFAVMLRWEVELTQPSLSSSYSPVSSHSSLYFSSLHTGSELQSKGQRTSMSSLICCSDKTKILDSKISKLYCIQRS